MTSRSLLNKVIHKPEFLPHVFHDNLHVPFGVHKLNDGKYSATGDPSPLPSGQRGHIIFCPPECFVVAI